MDPAETRTLLLRQHAQLRELLAAVQTLVHWFASGAPVRATLEARLGDLRVAFLEHNHSEEAALEPLLLGATDAWGPARLARMLEEHRAEHRLMAEFLTRPIEEIVPEFGDFAEQLEAHMAAEERTFLSVAVLH